MSKMASTSDNPPMAPEPTRLRQIALVAHDLERAKHLLVHTYFPKGPFQKLKIADQSDWHRGHLRGSPRRAMGIEEHSGYFSFLPHTSPLPRVTWITVPLGGDIIEVVSPISPSPSVPARRHLSKHGEGGYMIIMQTSSAIQRREYLQSNNLAKVIFEHKLEDSVCIQYHPKGIKGGVIPELDSHFPRESGGVPDGMKDRIAPWHACGPSSGFEKYREVMRKHSHLHLFAASLQLAPGDHDVEGAARQWEGLFGVKRVGTEEVGFTNARMLFLEGDGGEKEGLKEIVVGVEGEEQLSGILKRAGIEGLQVLEERGRAGTLWMLGVRWRFVLLDEGRIKSQL